MGRRPTDRARGYAVGQMVTGVYKGYARHFGFLIMEDRQEDIYIDKSNRNTAMHNDKVQVEVMDARRGAGRCEGRVVRVLERANEVVIGTYQRNKDFAVVIPDDERIGTDVYVPLDQSGEAKSGAKVSVRITKWPEDDRMAEGYVEEVLGYEGDKGLDITLIIANHRIPSVFPDAVLEEGKRVASEELHLDGRKDFRNLPIITVDGADAKDLDDAVYVTRKENGNFELGVHIADVSYYVRPRSELDKEAYRRGNSVYLADRVLPMLPEVLSNGICSLNEGTDKYTMSVVMEINREGHVVQSEVSPGIIRNSRRCTYAEIKKALLEDVYPDDLAPHLEMLKTWRELTEILIEMRNKRGALNFDFPEYKIMLDNYGKPLQIVKKDRSIAERMIEEAMLIANETVARKISANGRAAIFRVHRNPDKEKLEMLTGLLASFGLKVELSEEPTPKEIQALLKKAADNDISSVVEMMTLRSLPQAYYDVINWGHFGLASTCYTHFTSPIRRYPDLVVHRLLREVLADRKQERTVTKWLAQAAEQSSLTERRAVEAERETDDLKRTEYMAPFVGEAFDAKITGMTHFGIFVGLENGCEGLVHSSTIANGNGYFDEGTYTFRGHNGQQLYSLGEEVRVTLAKADIEKRMLDFVIGEVNSLEELAQMTARMQNRADKKKKNKNKNKKQKASRSSKQNKKKKKRGKGRRR